MKSGEFSKVGLVDSHEIARTHQHILVAQTISEKQNTMKQKYDSLVIYLYVTENEGFLPNEFRK